MIVNKESVVFWFQWKSTELMLHLCMIENNRHEALNKGSAFDSSTMVLIMDAAEHLKSVYVSLV